MSRVSDKALVKAQAVSGLCFASYLVLHLTNTALASLGQHSYDGYQRAVRHFYQAPVVELLLIGGAPLVHVAAGVTRMWRRRAREKARAEKKGGGEGAPLRMQLHRVSGYFILVFISGHVFATRGPGVILGHPVELSFVHFGLSNAPWILYPYYALLGAAGIYHLAHGLLLALRVLGARPPKSLLASRSPGFWAASGVILVAVSLGVLAMGGAFYQVDTAKAPIWTTVYQRLIPWIPLKH